MLISILETISNKYFLFVLFALCSIEVGLFILREQMVWEDGELHWQHWDVRCDSVTAAMTERLGQRAP